MKYKHTSEGTDTVIILSSSDFRIPLCVMITFSENSLPRSAE